MDPTEPTDARLLQAHADRSDPLAFAALRARYLNLVFAAAVRQTSDVHQAEDVTQAVFLLLASRAASLADREAGVGGWLLLTTRNVARSAKRMERRLKRREQKAAGMRSETVLVAAPAEVSRLSAVIDDAMAGLNPADRDVLAERFFRGRSIAQVAAVLRVSEAAAGKRLARALVRMRKSLARLGVTTSDAALAVSLPAAATGPTPTAALEHPATRIAARLARTTARAARLPAMLTVAALLVVVAAGVAVALHGSPPQITPLAAIPTVLEPQPRRIVLRLIDPATHARIANADVSIVDDTENHPPEPAAADGTYAITLPQPLVFLRAVCRAPGRVPMEINFTEGTFHGDRPREYVIPMETGTRIGGVVTNDIGGPLAGATVRVSNYLVGPMEGPQLAISEEVTTDADGRWHFDLAPTDLKSLMIELRNGSGPWVRPDITLPAEKLRDGTFTERLDEHRGRTFDGLVTDLAGLPINGAVVVFREDRYEHNSPSARTDANGRFHVEEVEGFLGGTIATVQAVGFAPSQQNVDEHSPAELKFQLVPASTLRGSVVDRNGEPVAHAALELERWNDNRALQWTTHTSTTGEFTWTSAPADEMQLNVRCSGYAGISGAIVQAGKPNRLVLNRPVQVVGTVTDAATHAPLDRFKITYGIRWTGSTDATWQPQESQTLTGGRFTASIGNFSNGGKIRVDADGYEPFISRWIAADEQNTTLEFAMKKGSGPAGVVLSPDGHPLAGIRVIGVQGGTSVQIDPESNDHLGEWQNIRLATTDDAGAFRLQAFDVQSPGCRVIVDSPQGYARADEAELVAANGRLRLQRWGVLHGTNRRGSAPAANATLTLSLEGDGTNQPLIIIQRRTTTDADGRFTFDQVPPGRPCQLYENVPINARSTRLVQIGHATVDAGQTVTATFNCANQ